VIESSSFKILERTERGCRSKRTLDRIRRNGRAARSDIILRVMTYVASHTDHYRSQGCSAIPLRIIGREYIPRSAGGYCSLTGKLVVLSLDKQGPNTYRRDTGLSTPQSICKY
jgi:hypothetical protein